MIKNGKYRPISASVVMPLVETGRFDVDSLNKTHVKKIANYLKYFSYQDLCAVARHTKYYFLQNPEKQLPLRYFFYKMRQKKIKLDNINKKLNINESVA